jgi:hypothetical protein
MFRATHRTSSGAQNCNCSLWFYIRFLVAGCYGGSVIAASGNLQHTDSEIIASSPTQHKISNCHIILWPVTEDNTQKLIRHYLALPVLSYLLPSAIYM